MPPTAENLAANLLGIAPTREVVEALLPLADMPTQPAQLPAPFSPPLKAAKTAAGRGVNYAAFLAASPHADPDVLRMLAGKPQKTVKRLVAANPATPPDALEKLASWALTQGDDETIDALLGTMRPSQYLPRIAHLRRAYDLSHVTGYASYAPNRLTEKNVVAYLRRAGDPAEVWATFGLGIVLLQREIVAAALDPAFPVPAAALVAATDGTARMSMLDAAVNAAHLPMPDPLVDMLVDMLTAWRAAGRPSDEPANGFRTGDSMIAGQFPRQYLNRISAARVLTEYAVERYVTSGVAELGECVVRSMVTRNSRRTSVRENAVVSDELLAQLVDTASPAAARVLLTSALHRLDNEQIAALAARVETLGSGPVENALKERGAGLAEAAVVDLLRAGGKLVTTSWLIGELPARPTASALRELAARPHRALASERDSYRPPSNEDMPVGAFVSVFASELDSQTADPATLDLVLNEAGPETLRLAVSLPPRFRSGRDGEHRPSVPLEYLQRRLTDRFGTDPDAWAMAARLAGKVTIGTVDDWLDVVAGMTAAGTAAA